MKKINQVLTGPYQGHMIVFTQGALWINTGLITLMRLDESVLRSAEPLTPPDETGEFNTLRVTYNDGTTSDLLMGPKLYAAALKSLASIVEVPEDEESVIPSPSYSSADASTSAEDAPTDGEAASATPAADGAKDYAEAPSPTSEPSAQPAAASTPAQPAKGTPAPTQGSKSAPKSTFRLVLTLLAVGIVAIIIFHLTGRL